MKNIFGPEQQLPITELLITTIFNSKDSSTQRSDKMPMECPSALQLCTFEISALTVPLNFNSILIFHHDTCNNFFKVS